MTRTLHTTRARRGVTLVELLVVLSIIVILLALTTAAVMKTRTASAYNRTSEYVIKLQKSLGNEVDRVNTKAGNSANVPAAVLTYAEGNPQRARAINIAIQQQLNFPQTFTEANSNIYIVYNSKTSAYGLRLGSYNSSIESPITGGTFSPPSYFAPVQSLSSGVLAANQESGVLLYIILSKASISGGGAMASASDDLSTGQKLSVTQSGSTFDTFADGFHNTIGFTRWYSQTEVQSAPYAVPSVVYAANTDPLDPQNLIGSWQNTTKQTELQSLGFLSGTITVNKASVAVGQNRVTTVYSYGFNGVADVAGASYGNDDVFGFRTLQPGNKGFHP